jgi:hypothetical protein
MQHTLSLLHVAVAILLFCCTAFKNAQSQFLMACTWTSNSGSATSFTLSSIMAKKTLDVKCKTTLTKTSYGTKQGQIIGRHGWMEMSFKSELHPHQEWPDWMVCNDTDILQTDGCSSGPIACTKVMEVFGILEPSSMATLRTTLEGIALCSWNTTNGC